MWTKLLSFAVNASTIVWLLPFQKLLSLMGGLVAVINQLKKEKEKKDINKQNVINDCLFH